MPSRTFKNLNLACLFSCMSTDEENWRSLGRMLDKKPKNQALRRGFPAASNTFETGQAVYEGLLPVEKARSVAGFWNSPDLLTGEILTTLDTWLSSFFHLLFPGLRNAAVASRASCWCICGHNRSSGKKAKTAALNTYYSEECFYCNSW